MKKLIVLSVLALVPQFAQATILDCELWMVKTPGQSAEKMDPIEVPLPEKQQPVPLSIGHGLSLTYYAPGVYDNADIKSGSGVLKMSLRSTGSDRVQTFYGTTELFRALVTEKSQGAGGGDRILLDLSCSARTAN